MAGGAVGWLHFAALIALGGAVAGRWLIATRAHGEAGGALVASARRIGIGAGTALIVAMGLVFWRQLDEFRDPFALWQEDAALLLATGWGRAWTLGTMGAALLPPLFAAAGTEARGAGATGGDGAGLGRLGLWIAASVVAGGVCAFPAFAGHAAGTGELRWLSIPVDILHVLAAGSWIGGLFLVLAADRMERGRVEEDAKGREADVLAAAVPVFSPVALASAGLLIATGAVSSFVQVESVGALFATAYGRLLLAKIALVVVVMALGAVNWRRLTPQIGTADGTRTLRRNAVRELAVAQLVILLTALLVRTSPGG